MGLIGFSLQDQVEKYGAYVGIAAFFGLAILSLLYFSQAREVKRLREWAGRAPERAAELGQRVTTDARRVVAQPQPRPAPPPGQQQAGVGPRPATAAAAAAATAQSRPVGAPQVPGAPGAVPAPAA